LRVYSDHNYVKWDAKDNGYDNEYCTGTDKLSLSLKINNGIVSIDDFSSPILAAGGCDLLDDKCKSQHPRTHVDLKIDILQNNKVRIDWNRTGDVADDDFKSIEKTFTTLSASCDRKRTCRTCMNLLKRPIYLMPPKEDTSIQFSGNRCFAYNRKLTFSAGEVNKNDIDECIQRCIAEQYSLAAIQFTSQCYCGNILPEQYLERADEDCNDGGIKCTNECTGTFKIYRTTGM